MLEFARSYTAEPEAIRGYGHQTQRLPHSSHLSSQLRSGSGGTSVHTGNEYTRMDRCTYVDGNLNNTGIQVTEDRQREFLRRAPLPDPD